MSFGFGFDYFMLVLLSSIGVLQIVFASNELYGLLFVRKHPKASTAIGLLFICVAYAWFFFCEFRNVPDTIQGLDGNQQAWRFALASSCGIFFTLILSSAINFRWGRIARELPSGIQALRNTTYLQSIIFRDREST